MFRLFTLLALLSPRIALAVTIPNPLGSEDLGGIFSSVTKAILTLAIPVAAAMYIWAGFLWLTAGARSKSITQAKDVLLYTTIGLIVIFIGGGFVDLIKSILDLGN